MRGKNGDKLRQRMLIGQEKKEQYTARQAQLKVIEKELNRLIQERGMVLLIRDVTAELDEMIVKKKLLMTAPRLTRNRGVKKRVPAILEKSQW